KDLWSEEEEKILIEAHKKLGNRWSEIARRITGRTENAVKNHWNAAKRRKEDKNHTKKDSNIVNSSSIKPSSLLQDYINNNSINLNKNCDTKISHQENKMTQEFEVHASIIGEEFDEELFFMLTNHLQPPPLQNLGFMDELAPNDQHKNGRDSNIDSGSKDSGSAMEMDYGGQGDNNLQKLSGILNKQSLQSRKSTNL
ncbi:hypothetical protein V2J09_019089, partial [Rumex salicifolius]